MPPKTSKIYVLKPSFKSLRIKKLQENTRRKHYRRRYGRSNISQKPILASTPPKLRPILEESSSSDSDSSSASSSRKNKRSHSPKKSQDVRLPSNVTRRISPNKRSGNVSKSNGLDELYKSFRRLRLRIGI